MKRVLSLSLKLILSLTLLIATLIISLPFLLDPNDYKNTISEQVKAQTGRTLHIPGEIKLSLFPWLGVKLGEVELENAPGFTEKIFARMQEVDVRIQLLPLLDGDIKIGHLTLHGLKLSLQRNKTGRGNWEDLLPAAKTTHTTANPSSTNKTTDEKASHRTPASTQSISPAAALAALSIEGISIKDAGLRWDDQLARQHYKLEKLNVEIGRISLTDAIPLDVTFDFNSHEPKASAHIQLTTKLQADLEKQFLTLDPFTSTLNYSLAKSANMPAAKGTLNLSSQLFLDLKKQRYTLKQLAIQNKTTSSLLPTGRLDAQIVSKKIRLDLTKQSLKTEFLQINAYGLKIESRLNVQQLLNKPRYLASVNVTAFNPRTLMKNLAMDSLLPATADAKTLARAQLGLRIIGNTDNLLLKPLILQLDDSNLQGHISVDGLTQPAVRYKLVLDQVDLDRYLPATTTSPRADKKPIPQAKQKVLPVTEQHNNNRTSIPSAHTQFPTSPAAAVTGSIIELPLELLRNLNIDGKLTINKLNVAKLRLQKITLGTVAKKGQIRLKPLSAKLYQGNYNGDIQIDVRSNTPHASLNERLKNVAIGPLLKDLIGDDKLRGTATIQAKLTSSLGQGGLDILAAKKSLNGRLNFVFENGAVKGFNLAQYERELKAKLKKQSPSNTKAPLETDFARISGSATIRNGLLDNRDLRAALPHARVKGQGKVNLVKEQLDYRLDVKFTSAAEGQSGKRWEQMNKVALPVYIRGAFAQPAITVDYQAVLKILAKQELKKQQQKVKAKLRAEEQKLKQKAQDELKQEEEKIKQKAKEALKKLFKF